MKHCCFFVPCLAGQAQFAVSGFSVRECAHKPTDARVCLYVYKESAVNHAEN